MKSQLAEEMGFTWQRPELIAIDANIVVNQQSGEAKIPMKNHITNLFPSFCFALMSFKTNGDTMTPKGPPASPPMAASSFPRFV